MFKWLWKAAQKGRDGDVRGLLGVSECPFTTWELGLALTVAAYNDHVDVVKLLLDHPLTRLDVAPEAPPLCGSRRVLAVLAERRVNYMGFLQGVLRAAVENLSVEAVRMLAEANVSVNCKYYDGTTLLGQHTATYTDSTGSSVEVLKILLSANAQVNARRALPPHAGAQRGVLHAAVRAGRTDIVQLLVDAKAELDARTPAHGETPLCAAAKCRAVGPMRILLDAKATLDVADDRRNAPVHYAISSASKSHHVLRVLLAAKADVNLRGAFRTPVQAAARSGDSQALRLLVHAKADIDPKTQASCV
jgi:ankyrin repeat protein